jgi:hypothetical protein
MARARIQGQIDIFNVLNVNTEVSYRSTNYNTTAYLQPSSVLQGRMIGLGVQRNGDDVGKEQDMIPRLLCCCSR